MSEKVTLKDVYAAVNRIEDKLDGKIRHNSDKIDVVEGKVDNILGKIGIGVMIFSATIAGGITLLIDFFKSKFK